MNTLAYSQVNVFESCQVKGSTTIFDPALNQWFFTDSLDSGVSTQPASTFKIINLLIALEAGAVSSVSDSIRWPGETDTTLYGYRPEIYHDMTVKEAFEVSAGWVFIEIAKKINRNRYRQLLSAASYGNGQLSEPGQDFWNFGDFGVSPAEQVQFLARLYKDELPFSKPNMSAVREVMVQEKFADGVISAKTGWTRIGENNIGWWVGWYQSRSKTLFFATRIIRSRVSSDAGFGECRKSITRTFLTQILRH